MSQTTLMPAAFIGHGSPMNTLQQNRYTEAWRSLGRALPRPRAVLVVSAHWFVPAVAVTAMAKPRVIHDFHGFPPELHRFDYPAPGDPDLAAEIAALLAPLPLHLDERDWGIDHGAWSVLAHVLPEADVPVLQLSMHSAQPLAFHRELGARLAPLRARGVFILCSGNIVHNLRRMDASHAERGFDWADRFDAAAETVLTTRPVALEPLLQHADYPLAVPTVEHFLPLAYFAGLCTAADGVATPWLLGRALGSLSMSSYVVGLSSAAAHRPAPS